MNLSRLIIPHFLSRGSGSFALMSSISGKTGVPFSGTYTASKHALHVRFWFFPICFTLQGKKFAISIWIQGMSKFKLFLNSSTVVQNDPGIYLSYDHLSNVVLSLDLMNFKTSKWGKHIWTSEWYRSGGMVELINELVIHLKWPQFKSQCNGERKNAPSSFLLGSFFISPFFVHLPVSIHWV